jgi:hypothetical protein
MATGTVFGTATEYSFTSASLADAGTATSTAVDLSAVDFIGIEVTAKLIGLAGSTDTVDLYVLESGDGADSDYATTDNKRFIGSVQMNGTTEAIKRMVVGNLSDRHKLHVVNESGAALSATEGECQVFYRTISYE